MRYKGRPRGKAVERAFPHIVEVVVPLGGLGKHLDDMHAWHLERGIKSRTRSARRDGRDTVRWCFATAAAASAFKDKFGGEFG